MDIISFNRYNSWYSNTGHLDMIVNNVVNEATSWHNKYNKPVLMSEYGADTVAGLHIVMFFFFFNFASQFTKTFNSKFVQSPSYVWSEEYQVQMMSRHFQAFDKLREKGFFIGEFIWNFADFKTAQSSCETVYFYLQNLTLLQLQRTRELAGTGKEYSQEIGSQKPVPII